MQRKIKRKINYFRAQELHDRYLRLRKNCKVLVQIDNPELFECYYFGGGSKVIAPKEMIIWLEKNMEGQYSIDDDPFDLNVTAMYYRFELEEDAVKFKLTWAEKICYVKS